MKETQSNNHWHHPLSTSRLLRDEAQTIHASSPTSALHVHGWGKTELRQYILHFALVLLSKNCYDNNYTVFTNLRLPPYVDSGSRNAEIYNTI